MNILLRVKNYITRYAPSELRLVEYLNRKKHPNPHTLLSEIGYDEAMLCDIWMRTFIASGKSEFMIRQKLLQKKFPKTLVEKKIEQFTPEIHNWDNLRGHLQRRVEMLLGRKKSLPYIKMLLVREYPKFRDDINDLLSDFSDLSSLKETIQKYKNRYTLSDFASRQKFTHSLLQKGFRYGDIAREIKSLL